MLNRLAELRRAKGLSQQTLAERVGTGKSQIVKLERGERRLDVRWIARLSEALEVPPQALLANEAPHRVDIVGYVGAGTRIEDVTLDWVARVRLAMPPDDLDLVD